MWWYAHHNHVHFFFFFSMHINTYTRWINEQCNYCMHVQEISVSQPSIQQQQETKQNLIKSSHQFVHGAESGHEQRAKHRVMLQRWKHRSALAHSLLSLSLYIYIVSLHSIQQQQQQWKQQKELIIGQLTFKTGRMVKTVCILLTLFFSQKMSFTSLEYMPKVKNGIIYSMIHSLYLTTIKKKLTREEITQTLFVSLLNV